jgi:hypothetical protein
VSAGRKALLVATYDYADRGLSALAAPGHDAEDLAEVLRDPAIAGFDVTMLMNEPTHVVGEAITDFYGDCGREDLTLLYFSGHGLKDDSGRLYLAMANTRRDALLFTALGAAQINDAMEECVSRRKVLILDCCYSGAFPAGTTAKSDQTVHALERFQGKGRAVLTASDATQYSFEGTNVQGAGSRSVFTRYLVEAIRTGKADLDADGDITLDELYSYVRERVVADMPQQRPKKQEDVDGRIVIARNVHWDLPQHLRHAIASPIAAQRLSVVEGLADLYRRGNEVVRASVAREIAVLAHDDSRSVSMEAAALLDRMTADEPPAQEPMAASDTGASSRVEERVAATSTGEGADADASDRGRGTAEPTKVEQRAGRQVVRSTEPGWRVRHSLWLVAPLLGFGLLTWAAFLYIGLRTHHRPWLVASALYGTAAISVVAIISSSPAEGARPIDAVGGLILVLEWAVGFAHALVVNPRYLTMLGRSGHSGPPPVR